MEILISESNHMVGRDKCEPHLLCKKEKGILRCQEVWDWIHRHCLMWRKLSSTSDHPQICFQVVPWSIQYWAMTVRNFGFWCSWNKRWCCHNVDQDVIEVPSSVVWCQWRHNQNWLQCNDVSGQKVKWNSVCFCRCGHLLLWLQSLYPGWKINILCQWEAVNDFLFYISESTDGFLVCISKCFNIGWCSCGVYLSLEEIQTPTC